MGVGSFFKNDLYDILGIYKTHVNFETIDTAKVIFPNKKFVHSLGLFVALISFDVSDSCKRWVTYDDYVKVNCNVISLKPYISWIVKMSL